MKLPWSSEEKQQQIQELEEKIQELEEERNRLNEQFQAEKERRSKLASEKQEAEEQKNRLQDKLRNQENPEKITEEKEKSEWEKLGFQEAKKGLEKINSVESPEKDLVTVYSPGKISELPDLKGLKNSLSSETYSKISSEKKIAAFMDDSFFGTVLRTRPFFQANWSLGKNFEAGKILEFIEKEKIWALISANKTQVFRESNGNFEKIGEVKNRVEKKQKKGGFSQGRFERKREEQIQQHVDETREKLENLEEDEIFLLGEKKLCTDLPGKYLGGFDSSKPAGPDLFYSFQMKKFQ